MNYSNLRIIHMIISALLIYHALQISKITARLEALEVSAECNP